MNPYLRPFVKAFLVVFLAFAAAVAGARPVLYTLRTVADGKIGTHVFSEALVTFQMRADTRHIVTEPSAFNGGIVYTNTGETTVTVLDGTHRIVARFKDPLVVRYDTGAGVAGFASSISSTYPIALNCSETHGCPNPGGPDSLGSGTLGVLLGLPNVTDASQDTLNLPVSLARTTLLTGPAFTCAGAYTVENPGTSFAQLGVCAAAAPKPLNTSRGDFYLQDQIGGSTNNDPIPADSGANIYYGWDLANYGSLQVEVLRDDRDD